MNSPVAIRKKQVTEWRDLEEAPDAQMLRK